MYKRIIEEKINQVYQLISFVQGVYFCNLVREERTRHYLTYTPHSKPIKPCPCLVKIRLFLCSVPKRSRDMAASIVYAKMNVLVISKMFNIYKP